MTRHNIGFRVVETLAEMLHASPGPETEFYTWHAVQSPSGDLALVCPQTYMNNSGRAVREAMDRFDAGLDEVVVMVDDFQLPFGTLRLRGKGSDGGHNGLASIIYHVQSDLFPRLRIGVAGATMPERHTHDAMAGYVLERFTADEEKVMPQLLRHAADAALSWAGHGIARTMSQYNKNFFTSGDFPERVL